MKAYSIDLSDKHLRQAVNYGANEGIDWAILTNGRQFQLYKILFEKPISEKLVFEIDLTAEDFNIKDALDDLSYLHRDSVVRDGLLSLWSRYSALDPYNVAGFLFAPQVVAFLRKELRNKYETKFEDDDIIQSLTEVVCTQISEEKLKIPRFKSAKKKVKVSKIFDENKSDNLGDTNFSENQN